jgi:hypothetical protein
MLEGKVNLPTIPCFLKKDGVFLLLLQDLTDVIKK